MAKHKPHRPLHDGHPPHESHPAHGHPGKDKHAHASHHAMNKHHGTPDGFDGGDEYGDEASNLSHGHHNAESMTKEHYSGSEGQGVPGGMEGNYEVCD